VQELEIKETLMAKQAQDLNQKELEIVHLKENISTLFEQLCLARVERFSASLEKGDNPQLSLFNEAENTLDNLTEQ